MNFSLKAFKLCCFVFKFRFTTLVIFFTKTANSCRVRGGCDFFYLSLQAITNIMETKENNKACIFKVQFYAITSWLIILSVDFHLFVFNCSIVYTCDFLDNNRQFVPRARKVWFLFSFSFSAINKIILTKEQNIIRLKKSNSWHFYYSRVRV